MAEAFDVVFADISVEFCCLQGSLSSIYVVLQHRGITSG